MSARLCSWTDGQGYGDPSDGEAPAWLPCEKGVLEAPSVSVRHCAFPPSPPTHSDLHTQLHGMWVSVVMGCAGKAAAGREQGLLRPLLPTQSHCTAALV